MVDRRPSGFQRWLFRAPIVLYRARLGALLGQRFVMIEHLGRRSGLLRRTVLEVVDRSDREVRVVAGYGPSSDWYRNLEAGGLEAVWVGSRRHPDAAMRFVPSEEAAEVIARYEAAHPRTAERLYALMGVSHDGSSESRTAMMREIPMVAFRVG